MERKEARKQGKMLTQGSEEGREGREGGGRYRGMHNRRCIVE
jgi:hypothetical protein